MEPHVWAIERAALASWPAADDTWVGTWLVRRDRGYTKRANCIYAFPSEPDLDLDARLAECRALMTQAGLPVIIRESGANPIPGLAAAINARSMRAFDESIVMTRPLNQHADKPVVHQADVDAWLNLYLQFEGGTKGNQQVHRQILDRIAGPKAYGVLYDDGQPVSIGLAVVDETLLGLFDIATAPNLRGQGYGTEIVAQLLSWGASVDCTSSYLQVTAGNTSAQRLYARLGFTESFRYHYYRARKD